MSGSRTGGTEVRRQELYRDRWSSSGTGTGLVSISDQPSPAVLKEFEIFREYDDKFLDKISADVAVAVWKQGSVLFEEGSYIDVAFFVVDGEVEISLEGVAGESGALPIFDLSRTMIAPAAAAAGEARGEPPPGPPRVRPAATEITFLASMDFDLPRGARSRLGPGELFGEIGALSGWPQSITARTVGECRLVQIRVPALRQMRRRSAALKTRLDEIYRRRSLAQQLQSTPLLRGCHRTFIEALKEEVELISLDPDEVLVSEGEGAEAFFLVRSGFLKLRQRLAEGDLAVSYLSKGMTLGEVELLLDEARQWRFTASSVEFSELVKIPLAAFTQLLTADPSLRERLAEAGIARLKEAGLARQNMAYAEFNAVALDSGLVQGNSILAIDLNRCTRCDDCVRACADTHGGRPRFVREGNKYQNLLIAKSCYQCRDPVCLVGCPTGAIHRSGLTDVVDIVDEICIGCSTCANNCPYDAIVMHATGETWPDDMLPVGLRGRDRVVASKCDQCADTGHGPACVSNCPQACAYRVGSLEELEGLLALGR